MKNKAESNFNRGYYVPPRFNHHTPDYPSKNTPKDPIREAIIDAIRMVDELNSFCQRENGKELVHKKLKHLVGAKDDLPNIVGVKYTLERKSPQIFLYYRDILIKDIKDYDSKFA